MGNESDYNHALKARRPPGGGRERILCIEQRSDDTPSRCKPGRVCCPVDDPNTGSADTEYAAILARREVEQEVAARLAVLEFLDPSQKRPTPRPNVLNKVDFFDL